MLSTVIYQFYTMNANFIFFCLLNFFFIHAGLYFTSIEQKMCLYGLNVESLRTYKMGKSTVYQIGELLVN